MPYDKLSLDEWWTDLLDQKDEEIAILKEKLNKRIKMEDEHVRTVSILLDRNDKQLTIANNALVDIVNYAIINNDENFSSGVARYALNKMRIDYAALRKAEKIAKKAEKLPTS